MTTFGEEARKSIEEGYIQEHCVGQTLRGARREGHVFSLDFGEFVINFNPNYKDKSICTRVLKKTTVYREVATGQCP